MAAAPTVRFPEGGETLGAQKVHLLPCSISHDGPTDVGTYFVTKDAGGGEVTAALRGRSLRGVPLQIPEEQQCWVLHSDQAAEGAAEWRAAARLEGFTHWSHDADPKAQSAGLVKLLQEYPTVAGVLAAPVTPEQLAALGAAPQVAAP
eukprot:TRINITY_DN55027_c0_g1_i1.p2 TRINITY_DN55027_c0_g1~~TRINITY_DN55027_c0_g1_i1.p2  ORF type:complete len:148 (+),score=32.25 TRINITY_DN55027_c0_g1_i1:71-514(+)